MTILRTNQRTAAEFDGRPREIDGGCENRRSIAEIDGGRGPGAVKPVAEDFLGRGSETALSPLGDM